MKAHLDLSAHAAKIRGELVALIARNLEDFCDIDDDPFGIEVKDENVITYLAPGPDVFDTSKRLRRVYITIITSVQEVEPQP